MPNVAITIVSWNSLSFLPDLLASVRKQTFGDISVIVVDNASNDGVVEFLRSDYPEVVLIRNPKNRGFAHAQNQGIEYARTYLRKEGEELFVLVTNPDIILEPKYVETVVGRMQECPEAGSATGKLLRVHREGSGVLQEHVKTDVIDSTGLSVRRSRRMIERDAGKTDDGEMVGRTEEIFGVSGALAMYRMKALEDVSYRGEYFDSDFFAYKEDIDLAWRLRMRGWTSLYVPFARAYHYRTAQADERESFLTKLRNRRQRARIISVNSYRNHLLTMMKNDYLRNTFLHLPFVASYEVGKFLFLSLFEPRTVSGAFAALRMLPRMAAKRRLVMQRATVSPKEMRRWFR